MRFSARMPALARRLVGQKPGVDVARLHRPAGRGAHSRWTTCSPSASRRRSRTIAGHAIRAGRDQPAARRRHPRERVDRRRRRAAAHERAGADARHRARRRRVGGHADDVVLDSGDEAVRIPASGFGIAASVAKSPNATGKLPALILIGGSGPTDRDGFVAGIPILGQIAADLVRGRVPRRPLRQARRRAERRPHRDVDARATMPKTCARSSRGSRRRGRTSTRSASASSGTAKARGWR